jgi:signal peptide peptidase SppA
MKFQRIYEAVHFKPWLITPRAHASIRYLLDAKLHENMEPRIDISIEDLFDEQTPQPQFENGIAIIPVVGVIGNKLGIIEKSCGAVGVEDVASGILTAIQDPSIKAIFLDISSPGGTVGGVPELAELISQANKMKPVFAYTDGDMCSAAYWLGASGSKIFASKSAEIGSIGVYLPWVDASRAYENEGLKVDLIKNKEGKFKGAGFEGTSLTDDQRAQLQAGVQKIFEMFKADITANRTIPPYAMQGQTFIGNDAEEAGLIDGVMSRDDALSYVLESIKR